MVLRMTALTGHSHRESMRKGTHFCPIEFLKILVLRYMYGKVVVRGELTRPCPNRRALNGFAISSKFQGCQSCSLPRARGQVLSITELSVGTKTHLAVRDDNYLVAHVLRVLGSNDHSQQSDSLGSSPRCVFSGRSRNRTQPGASRGAHTVYVSTPGGPIHLSPSQASPGNDMTKKRVHREVTR